LYHAHKNDTKSRKALFAGTIRQSVAMTNMWFLIIVYIANASISIQTNQQFKNGRVSASTLSRESIPASFFSFLHEPRKSTLRWYERRPKQVPLPFVLNLYRLTMFALPRIARGKASFVFTRHVHHFCFICLVSNTGERRQMFVDFLFEMILMLSFFLFSLSRWDRDARFKNLLWVPVRPGSSRAFSHAFSHWTHLLRISSVGPMLLALHDGTFVTGICP
jgi:hypothetical protein